MYTNKKYYYLKLKDSFFDREEIKVIKGMKKGDTYVCIMIELYLRSLKRDGLLMMTDRIPYNLETLSSVLSRNKDEVKYAVELFEKFELVEILDSGQMYMTDIQNYIGMSSTEGDRKREYRKMLDNKNNNPGHLSDTRPPELEKELELEKEIKPKKEPPLWKTSFKEYKRLCKEGFDKITEDKDWVNEYSRRFKGVDIIKSLIQAYSTYWSTEDGWKKKKSSKTKEIDWYGTCRNILRQNWNHVGK